VKRRTGNLLIYFVLSFFVIIFLFPFLWMVSTSFKDRKEAFKFPPEWLPDPIVFENFVNVWQKVPFDSYLLNTFFVTIVIVICQLAFSSMAAYGFSRIQFPGRDFIFLIFLSSMMIPPIVTMIPLYVLVSELQWLNTFKAVIIPQIFVTAAFGVFFMRQFFLTIPKDIEDAASIDGASIFRTFLFIILPIAKPALATIGVLTFVNSWNNFLWPLIVINTPNKHLISVGLANLQGQFSSDWTGIMAGSFITLIPILIVFFVAQKYFIESIHVSGFK
jgi:multiple sugar transport system permease protein